MKGQLSKTITMPELEKLVTAENPPDGWYSASDLAEKFNQSTRTMKSKMDKLAKDNKIETALYRGKNYKSTTYYKVGK